MPYKCFSIKVLQIKRFQVFCLLVDDTVSVILLVYDQSLNKMNLLMIRKIQKNGKNEEKVQNNCYFGCLKSTD